jgi:hypothetical protein
MPKEKWQNMYIMKCLLYRRDCNFTCYNQSTTLLLKAILKRTDSSLIRTYSIRITAYFSMKDLNEKDILLGRGPFCYRNPGNIAFRNLIQAHVASYPRCAPRTVKKKIVQKLISEAQNQGYRFLIYDKDRNDWCEAHPYVVNAKVSHALRDARLSTLHASIDSTKNLSKSCQSGKRKKTISNDSQVLSSSHLNLNRSKDSVSERGDISSIDRKFIFPCDIQESRQQTRNFNNGNDALYNPNTLNITHASSPKNAMNDTSFISPNLRYVTILQIVCITYAF